MNNFKKFFNDNLNDIENYGFKGQDVNTFLDPYFKTLEGYESLLNIPYLITEEDITSIENNLINTDEYHALRFLTDNVWPESTSELKEEYINACFEDLQIVVEKMVFEVYKERAEELREMGFPIKDIDELAVAFKDGTWTFTPLHIEEDGSKSIAAHSVEIDLNYVNELFLTLEEPSKTISPKEEQVSLLLNECNNIEVKNERELEWESGGLEI